MCSFWSEIEHEMHSLRYKNALSELFQSFKGCKFSGVEKQKKTSDDRKYKKTWNWDRQIIFWDNWITSITSITPITLITLITPITSITKKNQGPKLKANHKSHQSHQSHFWSELSHKEPLVKKLTVFKNSSNMHCVTRATSTHVGW